MALTRRTLLKTFGLSFFAKTSLVQCQPRPITFDVSSSDVAFPIWLIKGGNSLRTVKLISIRDYGKEVVFGFSKGTELRLSKRLTYRSDVSTEPRLSKRQQMLIKRLKAFLVNSAFIMHRDKRDPLSGACVRVQFNSLQSEEMLRVTTVYSILELLNKLRSCGDYFSVHWSFSHKCFYVYQRAKRLVSRGAAGAPI